MRCPNLQNLELPFGTMDIEGTGNIFRDMLSKCPDVESLDIEACRFEKASTLETMIASFPKLRHVSLSVSHWQTAVQAVIDYHSRSLESVRICPGYLVHDRGIIYNLLAVCPNLRVFSATSPITAGAFLDLKVVSTKLRTLTMGLVLEMNALNLPNPDPMDFGMVRDRISRGQDAVFAKILEMQELEELVFVGRHPRTSEGLIVPFSSDKAILQLKTMKHMKRVSFYGSSQEW
ncbi:hypothetical protein EDD21DRAFT_362389 [Dissophora ornata]|nr:hypothetical protein EDD21DRAFT_362389 [Dissophora ornata]